MTKKVLLISSLLLFVVGFGYSQKFTIHGYVKDNSNGEALIGATIYSKETQTGTITNVYGFYSLSLPPGEYTIVYGFIGFEKLEKKVNLIKDIRLDIDVKPEGEEIEEVVVSAKKNNENVVSTQMSNVEISSKSIKKIPVLMGEVDVIKTLKLLPGVQPTGETSSGLSVRGGSRDQNLVLLDEATVYNGSHLLGLFSVFNNDAIKNVDFYKGNIPIQHGGRLASLIDIRMKDGNNKKLSGTGGIGLISSRLTLEAPIVKDKGSFIISGRRTYADLVAKASGKKEAKNTILYFYDLNLKANYKINDNNRIYLSGYFGRDVFKMTEQNQSEFKWGNYTGTFRWNHIFNKKLFANVSLIMSNYDYKIGNTEKLKDNARDEDDDKKDTEKTFAMDWRSDMQDYSAKIDFGYYLNPKNTIKFGANTTFHKYQLGKIKIDRDTLHRNFSIPRIQALEHAFYLGNEQRINESLALNYGVRFSIFQNIGKSTIYNFDKNFEKIDSTVYKKGDVFKTYSGFEPRVGLSYAITDEQSIKLSYSHSRQYVQLASNSTGGTPLDVWIPASPNTKPQVCDQFAAGYFRNFRSGMFQTSVEFYYKDMKNQIDFKDFASLMLNEELEGELRYGTARAYGVELFVRKVTGKFTGWVSYTYSRSERKIKGINENRRYLSPFDRPHNISIVGNYELNDRVSFSANWVFLSGNAFTSPSGRFRYKDVLVPVFTERNEDRMPDYHRLDLGMTIDCKKKPGKKYRGSWTFSVYNAYMKKNANFINFEQDDDDPNKTQATMIYLFRIIPTVTYNFKF